MKNKNPGFQLLVLLAAFMACAVVHADTPAPVENAYNAVQATAQSIMVLVYPSVTFNGIDGCQWTNRFRGYDMTCQFTYTDMFNDTETRKLHFELDDDGRVRSITDGGGPSIVAPFATTTLLIGTLVTAAREDVSVHPEKYTAAETAFVRALPENPQPDQLLVWLLNVRIRSQS